MCVCVCVSLSLPATFSSKCSETAMAMSRAVSTYAVPSYNATPDLSVKGVPPSLLSPEGSRLDGRLPHECRPAYMKTGAVNAAAGSAYAEFGQTKVIVSVYGPRESKKAQAFSDIGRLNCDVKFASFSTSVRGKASQGMEEKEYTGMLHKALECAVALHTFPKTTVDVFALILQSGGGDLAVVISCASMALADAGIVMYDLVPAVSLSCTGSEVLLDASMEEERWGDGGMIVAAMTSRNEITQLTMTGEWPSTKVSELCLDACLKLAELMRSCLKEQVVAGSQ